MSYIYIYTYVHIWSTYININITIYIYRCGAHTHIYTYIFLLELKGLPFWGAGGNSATREGHGEIVNKMEATIALYSEELRLLSRERRTGP